MSKPYSAAHYTITKWAERNGTLHDNYECVRCQFGTLYWDKMEEHLATADGIAGHGHAWAFPRSQQSQQEPQGPSPLVY